MSNGQVGSALLRMPYNVQQANGEHFAKDAIQCPIVQWGALYQGRHTMSNRQVGSALLRTPYDVQQASGNLFCQGRLMMSNRICFAKDGHMTSSGQVWVKCNAFKITNNTSAMFTTAQNSNSAQWGVVWLNW